MRTMTENCRRGGHEEATVIATKSAATTVATTEIVEKTNSFLPVGRTSSLDRYSYWLVLCSSRLNCSTALVHW